MSILAVDADKRTLQIMEANLHTVFPEEELAVFGSPLEAMKYAEHNRIEMIFTDVRLWSLDGYELIKVIRRKQQCFAYVVSGSREKPDDLRWMPVNGCFPKPITVEELKILKKNLEW